MVLILASSQEWMSPGLDVGVLSLPMKVTTGRAVQGCPVLCSAQQHDPRGGRWGVRGRGWGWGVAIPYRKGLSLNRALWLPATELPPLLLPPSSSPWE